MTFLDFLQEVPGMQAYALGVFKRIDQEATRVGAEIVRNYRQPDLIDASRSLQNRRRERKEDLQQDPAGKLAAVPALRVWAALPGGYGQTWLNWWVNYYKLYLEAQFQEHSQAAE